jgi:methanogenic corrinoid protein MtbC1
MTARTATRVADDAVERFLAAAHASDTAAASAVVEGELAAGRPLVEVLEGVVLRAQAEVGRRWATGEWTVAEEHLATAVAEEVVIRASASVPVGPAPRPLVVAACVEGEWHALAVRVVAVACRVAGWDVEVLGPSVPAHHLARHLHDRGPDAVALSCAMPATLVGARRAVEAARDTGTPVVVGGRAFGTTPARAAAVGADAWAPRVVDLVDVLAGWPAETGPAPPLRHPGVTEHHRIEASIDRIVAACAAPPDDVRPLVQALSAALLLDDETVLHDHLDSARATTEERWAHVVEALAEVRRVVGDRLPIAAGWLAR